MKILTFNIICSLLFGVERGTQRDSLLVCFQKMIDGIWAVPVNLPFTRYNGSIRTSARVQEMVRGLIREKRAELKKNDASSRQDLITYMLSLRREDKEAALTVNEIVDNVVVLMVAGYDTSSVLLTFILRLLANDPTIYAAVLKEHEDIAKDKAEGEPLTWEDLVKMKYSWKVAMETLRVVPPVFGGFRTAMRDIEFEGYIIPKGWQIFWASSMTHMDGSIFPEPEKFDPARFETQVPPYCFVPFGGGARICPGYEFARVETLITLHYLVTRFKWKLLSDNFYARDPLPVPAKGLLIKIAPKKD